MMQHDAEVVKPFKYRKLRTRLEARPCNMGANRRDVIGDGGGLPVFAESQRGRMGVRDSLGGH